VKLDVKTCDCGCGTPITGDRARFAHGHYLGNGRIPAEQYQPRLCGCGCGRVAPIAGATRRGYRKGEYLRFIQGHASRTSLVPPPPVRHGPDNNKWVGDAASYGAIHDYLNYHFPKADACDHCRHRGATDYALIDGRSYTRNRGDYMELCRTCHNRYDKGMWTR